jgi:hypothetical protein
MSGQERLKKTKGSEGHGGHTVHGARETGHPDDASDTSDLISFTMVDIDDHSMTPIKLQQVMPDSPKSGGVDSEDDYLSAFPVFDNPFSTSSFETSHESSMPDVTALQNKIQNLRATIRALKTEKQIAEERADRAVERITEMKELQQQTVENSTRETGGAVEDLQGQNRLLRDQLNDAQSHIFSLQPYRKELTPEEIGSVGIATFVIYIQRADDVAGIR